MPGPSQNSTTNSSNTTTPYDQSQLMAGINQASGALSTSLGNVPAQFTANMTPQQLAEYQSLVTNANSAAPAALSTEGLGGSLVGSGAGALSSAATGFNAFNPTANNNPNAVNAYATNYVANQNIPAEVQNAEQGAIDTANQITIPQLQSHGAATGNINSSAIGNQGGIVAGDIARNAENLGGVLQSQAYGTGANLGESAIQANNNSSLAALEGLSGTGSSSVNGGVGALTGGAGTLSSLGDLGLTGASGNQLNQQLINTNALQANQFPLQDIANYLGSIGGLNVGGSSTGTSNTQSQTNPGFFATLGSLIGAGGSLLGSKPGAFGGGSGILGMV